MRLRQYFFWWIAVAAVAPLTLAVAGLSVYGEAVYREQVEREIHAALSNIRVDIERSLSHERRIMLRAADSRALRRYLPVLAAAGRGELTDDFHARAAALNRFLLDLNNIAQGQGVLRVLDTRGNTLAKVGLGRISPPAYEGLGDIPYAESERGFEAAAFARKVGEIQPGAVGFVDLIERELESTVLDGVITLRHESARVGYLVTSLRGEQLDYLLQLAPRPYHGRLSLVEINPGDARRHGRVLYDDDWSLLFAAPGEAAQYAGEALLNAAHTAPAGRVAGSGHGVFYAEMFPYPDRLISWLIALRINDDAIATPFRRLRYGVAAVAAVTLLLSVFAALSVAGKIARPVAALAQSLRNVGAVREPPATPGANHANDMNGANATPAAQTPPAPGPQEITELTQAFTDMRRNLRRAQHERDRARDMAAQNAKLAGLGQLAAGVGHELNNPLNNMLSYIRLMQKDIAQGRTGDGLRQDLAAIREEGERASLIIRAMLDFARQSPPRFAPFTVAAWLRQSAALVASAAKAREVAIEIEAGADFTAKGDRARLQQALVNLMMNAIQAAPSGASVRLGAVRAGAHYKATVFNPGRPIAADIMPRLFEPFFTTKQPGEGSGLGLAIALGIVQQHNGALQLSNVAAADGAHAGVLATLALPLDPAGSAGRQGA